MGDILNIAAKNTRTMSKTELTAAPELQLPPRYQIRTVLKDTPGTCVYRVFDVSDKRDEAIKILRHELSDPQQTLRFKAEFTTLVSLDHPSIIKVFDFGLLQNCFPYFTMEYFAGKRISEYFDGQNWDELYDVILQIASALHHIHHLGIIHLDLKPSNVLVSEKAVAKIMDFGLAIESHSLFDRKIRGTLQYMAPEVLKQDRVDSRADLYALGMTLYETVTGALPGYGKAPIDVIRMHLDEDVRPPSAINPRVPPELERIIMRLLEKDPRDRYPSAAALLLEVAEAAGKTAPTGALLLGRGELFAAPLIGRRTEVNQLGAMIDEAHAGRGTGVIIAGNEGMGKKRIVRDATLRAQLDGARVFCGRCPVNRKTIYAPFFEIFHQLVTAVNPDADVSEEIRRILRPVTVATPEPPTSGNQGDKYRLYNRIVQSMQDIYGYINANGDTAGTPLIIVIEDLQWADPSTSELFSFLIGEAKHNKLLVIGTLTLENSSEAAMEGTTSGLVFWEQKAKEGGFPLIRVDALSEPLVREHIQSLLGEHNVTDEFVRWMLWESAGSPLNIRRIIDYLINHDHLQWSPMGWSVDVEHLRLLRIPSGAASILLEKVDSLQPAQRAMLEVAATSGEVSELDLLTKISDLTPEETYQTVRQLIRSNLLDEFL